MKTATLLSLATAALAAPTPNAVPTKVRLNRRRAMANSNNEVQADLYLGQLQYTLAKYGHNVLLADGIQDIIKRSGSVGTEALNDQGDDELYYGNVVVGSGSYAQTFTIDFDTGSSDFFVPGPQCTTANGCTGTVRYNQHGTDEHNTTMVIYGSGTVSGENYYDSVTVAGITATHQNVVSLTKATGFSGSDAEGLMGMAFESIANSDQPPVFQTMVAEGKVASPEFAFFLGREASGTGSKSELTLGGVDTSKYTGALTQVPLTAQTYWQVGVTGVQVGNKTSALSKATAGNAAIDTGTTIVLGPSAAVAAIYAQIPGSIPVPIAEGVGPTAYAYPCSENPNVSFVFAGTPASTPAFGIAQEDFNLGTVTSDFASIVEVSALTNAINSAPLGYCLGALAGFDVDPTEELYVVGDTFLKNWYAIFSFTNYNGSPSVSFGKSIDYLPA